MAMARSTSEGHAGAAAATAATRTWRAAIASARRSRRERIRREARRHQPRRQGGEGRPALRLCRDRHRRRRQGPRRPRLGQGARSAGSDPQGDRAGAAAPWSACRCAKAARCITTCIGHYGAGEVVVRAAPQGTGIIAGGPMRAIFEALGVQDVVAKSVGTSNPHNMIKATFQALDRVGQPARGRRAPRQEGLAISWPRREPGSPGVSDGRREDAKTGGEEARRPRRTQRRKSSGTQGRPAGASQELRRAPSQEPRKRRRSSGARRLGMASFANRKRRRQRPRADHASELDRPRYSSTSRVDSTPSSSSCSYASVRG